MMVALVKGAGVLVLLSLLVASVGAMPHMAAAVEIGQEAPDFTLPATTGGKVTLSQFRGKKNVLVEFYGVDFEPV
jgi:peroxiredoxin